MQAKIKLEVVLSHGMEVVFIFFLGSTGWAGIVVNHNATGSVEHCFMCAGRVLRFVLDCRLKYLSA